MRDDSSSKNVFYIIIMTVVYACVQKIAYNKNDSSVPELLYFCSMCCVSRKGAAMESASIARLANSRIPTATRNANYVNLAGTKIKQEHPNAKCAWKE